MTGQDLAQISVELLKESPSPALRTCAGLAQVQPYMARESFFAAGVVSCWVQLNEVNQDQLIRSFNNAFMSPNIPPEILAAILNLAEFMEHDEKNLPILELLVDLRRNFVHSEEPWLRKRIVVHCRFREALHYKEMEFAGLQTLAKDGQRSLVVEALIRINYQLNQHEAAVGILPYAQQKLAVELKESWYEKREGFDQLSKSHRECVYDMYAIVAPRHCVR